MKKFVTGILAAAIVASSLSAMTPARADNGRVAAGVAGGLIGGALLGAAIANGGRPAYAAPPPPPPPAYYAPEPVYVEPACQIQRERFWDGYGWRIRNVRVCE